LNVYATRSRTTLGAKYGIRSSPSTTTGTSRARLDDTRTRSRVAGISARYEERESVYRERH